MSGKKFKVLSENFAKCWVKISQSSQKFTVAVDNSTMIGDNLTVDYQKFAEAGELKKSKVTGADSKVIGKQFTVVGEKKLSDR